MNLLSSRIEHRSFQLIWVIVVITGIALAPGWGQLTPQNEVSSSPIAPTSASEFSKAPLSLPELVVPPLPTEAAAVAPTTRTISLKEAVELALREQPQLVLSRLSVEAAAARTKQTRSNYFPTLSVSAQHTRTGQALDSDAGTAGGTFTTGGYTTNFSARELIYDFGNTSAQVSQARHQQRSVAQALAQAQQDVINQVKQAYYTLLQNQRLVAVQQRNVSDQQKHLELAQARFQAGLAPHADVVRAETAVSEAILNLATAQNTAAVSRVGLNTAIGLDVRTPIMVAETEEPMPELPPPSALVEQALEQRPEIQRLRAEMQGAEDSLRAARTSNWPSLFLNGNYGLRGTEFPPNDASWSYGVSLQWSLFDIGLTRGRVQEAKANLASAKARLRQGELESGSQIVQAYLDLQTGGQKVIAAASQVSNAEENLKVATGRYQAGVATYIEVIDAETALITAQTNQVNALYGLSMARAAMARALGMEGY